MFGIGRVTDYPQGVESLLETRAPKWSFNGCRAVVEHLLGELRVGPSATKVDGWWATHSQLPTLTGFGQALANVDQAWSNWANFWSVLSNIGQHVANIGQRLAEPNSTTCWPNLGQPLAAKVGRNWAAFRLPEQVFDISLLDNFGARQVRRLGQV